MFKQVVLFLFVAVLSFSIVTPQVHAVDMSAALKRMDAIIAEMQSLRVEFASLATSVNVTTSVPTPSVQGAVSGGVLGDDLAFGSTNDDIKKIQALLATDPTIYPYGVASGYFGPKTQEAIRSFQARFGLDTVGVVGPSTKALLEVFFAAYPAGKYPTDILKQAKPSAQPVAAAQTTTPVAATVPSTQILTSLSLTEEEGEYIVRSYKKDGTRNRDLFLYPEDKDELITMIAKKLGASESEVMSLIDDDDLAFGSKKSSRKDADEDDAQDALDDADEAIDEARDKIRDADDDGDDVDDADELYDEARDLYKEAEDAFDDEDYDEAVELAEEAEELANDAIDELGGGSNGGSDDIDSIEVEVLDGESDVVVEYDDGDDERFTVEEDKEEDIIKEIADELDIDEDDVEDLVAFDYGTLERITVQVSDLDGVTRVRVYFESGVDVKFTFEEGTDEDEMIEEVADALNLRESDVEDEFDF